MWVLSNSKWFLHEQKWINHSEYIMTDWSISTMQTSVRIPLYIWPSGRIAIWLMIYKISNNTTVFFIKHILSLSFTLPFSIWHRSDAITQRSYCLHYSDVIISVMASQITKVLIVYSPVCSNADQRKHESSRHWPLWGEFTGHRWIPRPKGQLRGKCFHLMT